MKINKYYLVGILVAILFLIIIYAKPQINTDIKFDDKSHHQDDGFRNPFNFTTHNLADVIEMRFFDQEWKEWKEAYNMTDYEKVKLQKIQYPDIKPQATWIGHSTVLLQYNGINILTDPVFSKSVSPVSFIGPKRHHKLPLDPNQLPKIDYVIISHNHYDHLDVKTVEFLGNQVHWLVPLGIKEWLLDEDIKEENITELDWWQDKEFDKVKFTCTPAQHFSGRGIFDRNKTLWASWAIEFPDFKAWFGGDTGYNVAQFYKIGLKFEEFDLAMIPIGAYKPKWFMSPVHVDPVEAIKIHKDINSKYSFGIHWRTFRLSAEGLMEPAEELFGLLKEYDIPQSEFETLKIGETKIIENSKVIVEKEEKGEK